MMPDKLSVSLIRTELEKAFIDFMNAPEKNMIRLAEWMEIYVARQRSM